MRNFADKTVSPTIMVQWKLILLEKLPSLKLTFSNLKMDGWNTSFLLGRPICRGYVSFREGNYYWRHLFFTSMSIGGRVLNFESDFLQPAAPG